MFPVVFNVNRNIAAFFNVMFYFNMLFCTYLLGEEASLSIGNTLWRVSTMFTRWAITTPEVNGFG